MYIVLPVYIPEGQKRAPGLTTDGHEPTCGCWELKLGPVEKQPMLSTSEPPHRPLFCLREQAEEEEICGQAEPKIRNGVNRIKSGKQRKFSWCIRCMF